MANTAKGTKTERRILQCLYRLQTRADQGGQMGTYEWLMRETFASRPAILRTCQRLVREGKIIRRKINAGDRKRWERQWPLGFARRQAHFSLSLEMLGRVEAAQDNFEECFHEGFRQQIAEDQAGRGLQMSNGGYSIPDDY